MNIAETKQPASSGDGAAIFSLMANIFLVNFITGMMLSALPVYLHLALHQSSFVIGIMTGLQFISALVSRIWAGAHSDKYGPKSTVLIGLGFALASSAVSLIALHPGLSEHVSLFLIAGGRAMLGISGCFLIVGAVSWAISLMGRQSSGNAIARMGIAIYIGMALGAPSGSYLYGHYGMEWVVLSTIFVPVLGGLLIINRVGPISPQTQRAHLLTVIQAVWKPGLGLSFASLGYGSMVTFSMLLFVDRGWEPAWLCFTIFAVSFILARLLFSRLPDQVGGAKVALIFAIAQMVGLFLVAASPWAFLGFVGTGLIGFGYSLLYPGLGLEAVLRAPETSKGLAIGGYTAFLELTLGIGSPALGVMATTFGLGSVFLLSAVAMIGTITICVHLNANPPQD